MTQTAVPTQRPSAFWRFLTGIWQALEFSRNLVFNLLFLFFVVIVLIVMFSGGPSKIEPKTALVLDPSGAIVEQFSSSPVDRAIASATGEEQLETQLRDIVTVLEAAAKDPNIDRVLLVTHNISGMGPATGREFARALVKFKESKKPLYAMADGYDQRGYLLAAQADRIYMDPEGAVLLEGMARYRTYFRGAFDKFGIEPHLFRVGEYKSAGEPYIRSDASQEAKEADLYWMGDIWQRQLADIAKARGLEAEDLSAIIDGYVESISNAGGDLSKLALEQKLVDELMTRQQLRELMIKEGAADEDGHTFRQIDFDNYLARQNVLPKFPGDNQIAIVVAEGEITDGDQPPGTVGGDSTSRLLRDAREDEDVKAVVLRVDSPGGGVFPSELIRREVALLKEAGKPVVVSMGDLAASGGYWISMNANEIIADPSTITGSIGIYGLFMNVPEAMGKVGLNTDGVGTTWLAGAFDPTRPLDPRIGELIQQVINKGYATFIGRVAEARKQEVAAIDAVARGRVWSGAQAKERGLVDRLGSFDDAIKSAAKFAKLDEYETRYVEKEPSPFEAFMAGMSQSRMGAYFARQGWLNAFSALSDRPDQELRQLQSLLKQRHPGLPVSVQAHCECGVQ
jgi:protease IV